MWSTKTVWFDVAIVMGIFAVGNILFGHFEEHKPKALRVLKVSLVDGVTVALSSAGPHTFCFEHSDWRRLTSTSGGFQATGSTAGLGSLRRNIIN